MGSATAPPDSGCVHIWHAHIDEAWRTAATRRRAFGWLTAAERDRHDRYRHDRDRDMFLLGRAMARALVARALGVAPTEWPWSEGARGRPEIAGSGALSFNLAHSAGVVVCALSRDGIVGVDVEHRARPPVDLQLVHRFCAPAEVADIESQPADAWHDQFLKYWTLKEAYLKARGLGIAVHLADVSFSLGSPIEIAFLNSLRGTDARWAFALAELDREHFVAAARPIAGSAPRFIIEPLPLDLLPADS